MCAKRRQSALNETLTCYGSHVKKHDMRLLIGHIIFLTREKSDTRHLIGLHQLANENLLRGFPVSKSLYVYNKVKILLTRMFSPRMYTSSSSCFPRWRAAFFRFCRLSGRPRYSFRTFNQYLFNWLCHIIPEYTTSCGKNLIDGTADCFCIAHFLTGYKASPTRRKRRSEFNEWSHKFFEPY